MTKINTVVLDLDDVLNAFTMHVLGQLGLNVRPYDFDAYPTKCGFDIISAWVEMTGKDKPSVPEFWSWVDRGMWANAPKSEQFWLLDAAAEAVGRDNVIIATSPTKDSECLAGKHDWIMRHLPVWCQRQYNITPRKHKLAQPGYLLIDDSEANCNNFMVNQAGMPTGAASIIVPRPWNPMHGKDCDDYLSKQLSIFFPDLVF